MQATLRHCYPDADIKELFSRPIGFFGRDLSRPPSSFTERYACLTNDDLVHRLGAIIQTITEVRS